MELENQYSVVNEDITIEYDGDVKVTSKKGYDSKGRVVMLATYRDYPDGSQGHCVRVVEANGYWSGGAYDPIIGRGCQFAPEKFIEGPQFGITECLIQYKYSVNTPPPHTIRSG